VRRIVGIQPEKESEVEQLDLFPDRLPDDVRPRPYQQLMVSNCLAAWEEVNSTLAVMACGVGKTVCAGLVAKNVIDNGGRCLFVAHQDQLLVQARKAFRKICPQARIGTEMASQHADLSDEIVLASVQTLWREKRLAKFPPDFFWQMTIDECVPAGTLIDGVPIEQVRCGDFVLSRNVITGLIERHRVERIFVNPAPRRLIRLHCAMQSLVCTAGHPFWTQRGWVNAECLQAGDSVYVVRQGICRDPLVSVAENQKWRNEAVLLPPMPRQMEGSASAGSLCAVWQQFFSGVGRSSLACSARQAGILLSRMPRRISVGEIVCDDGQNQQAVCVGANAGKQSNVTARGKRSCFGDDESDGAQADYSGRQWSRHDCAGANFGGNNRLDAISFANQDRQRQRLSESLQNRLSGLELQVGYRSGWRQSQGIEDLTSGRAEGYFLDATRVDHVEILERSGSGEFDRLCPDGRVYNLEVEGNHNYFANDVLVHNCHHSLANTYRAIRNYFSSAKLLGLSATPDRSDKRAMNQVFESVCINYGIREAIDDGWLVPIVQIIEKIEDYDLSRVRTTASGDLNESDLAEACANDKVIHAAASIAIKYANYPNKWQARRPTLIFCPSVARAQDVADVLNYRHAKDGSGAAAAIHGKMDPDTRTEILNRYRSGEIQYLANMAVLTEGTDLPETRVIINLRPTKSRALMVQICGRSLRPCADALGTLDSFELPADRRNVHLNSPKPSGLVVDVTGVVGKHKLVNMTDILGGRFDDRVVQRAKKKAIDRGGHTGDIEKDLEAAAHEIAAEEYAEKILKPERPGERRLKTIIEARSSGRLIDPFDKFDTQSMREPAWFKGKKPTEKQERMLKRAGLSYDEMKADDMTRAKASSIINEIFRRQREGLCSLRVQRIMAAHGFDAENMLNADAKVLLKTFKRKKAQK
jgi:superfamily II DNA or RNA helicase